MQLSFIQPYEKEGKTSNNEKKVNKKHNKLQEKWNDMILSLLNGRKMEKTTEA
jgi:hypothetical protein